MHQQKAVIVTGGAQGIGKVVSLFLEKHGFYVAVFDNDMEALNEMKGETGGKNLILCPCDVSEESEVKDTITSIYEECGNVYGIVNNAAIAINKPITELSIEEWNKVLAINLSGIFLCTKHAVDYLKKSKGRIVNIASTRAFMSEKNTEAYSASKGGVVALTHSLAISLGPEICVNSISPGWIDVSALKKKSKRQTPDLSDQDHLQHPSGRVGNAADIARMVLFLLSAENDFINGQNFTIDGGMTKKMIYH